MTRDERILIALLQGELSTAELEELTGMAERTCRKGLRRLARDEYAWSPERGIWRLTRLGRQLATESSADVGAPRGSPDAANPPASAALPPRAVASPARHRLPGPKTLRLPPAASDDSILRIALNEGIEGVVRRRRSRS